MVQMAPIRDEREQVKLMMLTFTDISHIKSALLDEEKGPFFVLCSCHLQENEEEDENNSISNNALKCAVDGYFHLQCLQDSNASRRRVQSLRTPRALHHKGPRGSVHGAADGAGRLEQPALAARQAVLHRVLSAPGRVL